MGFHAIELQLSAFYNWICFILYYFCWLLTDEHNTAVLEFETNKSELKNMSEESIKTNLLFDGNY